MPVMKKNTVQKQAIRNKARKTRQLTADGAMRQYEEPQWLFPSQVYFVRDKQVDLVLQSSNMSEAPPEALAQRVAAQVTLDASIQAQMLEFLNCKGAFHFHTRDFDSALLLLKFVKLMTGERIAVVSELPASSFCMDFDVVSEPDLFSFEPAFDCLCYFVAATFPAPERIFGLAARVLLVHCACELDQRPSGAESKFKALSALVDSLALKSTVLIYSKNVSAVCEQLLRNNVNRYAIRRLEFLDRPVRYSASQIFVATDFLFSPACVRPHLQRITACLAPGDYLLAYNRVVRLALFDHAAQLEHAFVRADDLEMELLRFLNPGAALVHARFKAFPTNEQIKARPELLALRGKQLKSADADFPALFRAGVGVSGMRGYVTLRGADVAAAKGPDAREGVANAGVAQFIRVKLSQLADEFKAVFGHDRLPRFASASDENYRAAVIALCEGKRAANLYQLQQTADEINAEANDSLALILRQICENNAALRVLDDAGL